MNDQLPDFESTVPPMNEYPKPKKPRRKPTKKRAVRTVPASPKRVVKKAVKRRGRPAGSTNKPKLIAETSSMSTIIAAYVQIEQYLGQLTLDERKAMLECLK